MQRKVLNEWRRVAHDQAVKLAAWRKHGKQLAAYNQQMLVYRTFTAWRYFSSGSALYKRRAYRHCYPSYGVPQCLYGVVPKKSRRASIDRILGITATALGASRRRGIVSCVCVCMCVCV